MREMVLVAQALEAVTILKEFLGQQAGIDSIYILDAQRIQNELYRRHVYKLSHQAQTRIIKFI